MKTYSPIKFKSQRLKADAQGELPTTIELCHTGEWRTPWHGDFELNSGDLHEAVAHFDAGHYRADDGKGALPGTLDHDGGAAAYWIDGLSVEPAANDPSLQALVAQVTWTALGQEKVQRDEYRYTSFEFNPRGMPLENPEKQGEYWVNVLSGATLTNDPLLKKLKKVMASARTGSDNNNEGESMKLEDLRAKDASTLTDAEKTFLAEHKAELSDEERSKFDLTEEPAPNAEPTPAGTDKPETPADDKPEPAKVEASAGQNYSISKAEFEKLQAQARAGVEAKAQLDRERTERQLQAHVKTGRIKSSQVKEATEILIASSPSQRERIEALLASLPENRMVTSGEIGVTGDDADATTRFNAEIKKIQASAKVSYREAMDQVRADNPDLVAQYETELKESN